MINTPKKQLSAAEYYYNTNEIMTLTNNMKYEIDIAIVKTNKKTYYELNIYIETNDGNTTGIIYTDNESETLSEAHKKAEALTRQFILEYKQKHKLN